MFFVKHYNISASAVECHLNIAIGFYKFVVYNCLIKIIFSERGFQPSSLYQKPIYNLQTTISDLKGVSK